jgi:hypothetical protein
MSPAGKHCPAAMLLKKMVETGKGVVVSVTVAVTEAVDVVTYVTKRPSRREPGTDVTILTRAGTDVMFFNIFAKKFGEKIGVFDSKQS